MASPLQTEAKDWLVCTPRGAGFMAEETGVAIFMREDETGAGGGGARGRCGVPLSCSVEFIHVHRGFLQVLFIAFPAEFG